MPSGLNDLTQLHVDILNSIGRVDDTVHLGRMVAAKALRTLLLMYPQNINCRNDITETSEDAGIELTGVKF